jgi:purine-nucleoside phosphorylase
MLEYERICACVEDIRKLTSFQPELALVLGSGLGDVADSIEIETIIDYKQISSFPVSTVNSHKGRFVFGKLGNRNVICMQGRVHYYEGYSMQDVVLPIRVMGMLGAKKLLLTNASGGINNQFKAGDFMMITGHIPTFIPNPLIGSNIEELGCRFPGMDQVYDLEMQESIRKAAKESFVDLKEGKYVQLTGPSFETPEEILFLRMIGADAVGMSTVCEAIAAVHMGMKVAGISCVSNMAAGMSQKPLSANDVNETTNRIHESFERFIKTVLSFL